MAAQVAKKNFDFRMSKKVAELTQVVHMLFTRNHEKEVELEAVKNAYEYEIELVMKDAQQKIDKVQNLLYESERLRHGDNDKLKADMQGDHERIEQNWKKKVELLEQQLQSEKLEGRATRDMLIDAQQDIEHLKSAQIIEIQQRDQQIIDRDKEIEQLKRLKFEIEKKYGQYDSKNQNAMNAIKKENDILEAKLLKLNEALDETERSCDRLTGRNRQLEHEVRLLKAELGKQAGRDRSGRSSASTKQEYMEYSSASIMDYGEEMEKLRRLVARYRMELSNRDSNFNRMFSDQTPVIVNKRVSSRGSVDGGTPKVNRERSSNQLLSQSMPLSVANQMAHPYSVLTTEEDLLALTSPRGSNKALNMTSSSGHRLPTMDQRQRLQRLAKPRPLSKTLLTAGASKS